MSETHDDDALPQLPSSEVGSQGQRPEDTDKPSNTSELLRNMDKFFQNFMKMSPPPVPPAVSQNAITFVRFDPDDPDADIEGWCKITELIVVKRNLDGVELLIALTNALKGRAASCLTQLNVEHMTWSRIKELLLAKFSRPKLAQEYFDDILRFQIGTKETVSEASMRLWNLIERIPKTEMPEDIITGFVVSILCQKDSLIRRELSSQVLTSRAQLYRVLNGISLKRRHDNTEDHESDPKRPRNYEGKFNGKCHWCGIIGHRQSECRKRRDEAVGSKRLEALHPLRSNERNPAITCYTCGQLGHLATACPIKRVNAGATVKEVNACQRKTSRGTLTTDSGELVPFLFDTGSDCSLVRFCDIDKFSGALRNDVIVLSGIGGSDVKCDCQILSKVTIQDIPVSLLFHVVPNDTISEPVLIGRDVLSQGVSVEIDSERILFCERIASDSTSDEFKIDIHKVDTDLTGQDKIALLGVLNRYADSFTEGLPTRRVTTEKLVINLVDPHKTVQRQPYRMSPSEKQVVREKVQELLDAGIIRESTSPFASPILLVKKKDNTDRMCVDFRELNSNTKPEHYPLPRIDECIDKLNGAQYFSLLDMASGFHGIAVHPDSVEKTAFVTPDGQYEYLAMPFGLRNAPSVYQRAINKALTTIKDNSTMAYMDDVLCYSASILEGLEHLDQVLKALTDAGFTLNIDKCKFMKTKIEYLGYSVQSGKVRPNSRKVQALVDAPPPKTATQVRQFLGLVSYFRKFIPGFSRVMGPLYPLTKLKGPIVWTEQFEAIRQKVISILTSEPVLTIFNPDLPVELHTDASSEGYGAILIQKKDNLPHVVAYFSRRTTEVESRYHSYELETLAVVRAVENFRHYLYGRHFVVFTDCNSLKASKSKTDLTPRVHRWWAYLQAYDFDIVYREGKNMEHADYLSRNPLPSTSSEPQSKLKSVRFVELHKGWLMVEQRRDSEISDLITKHENKDLPEQVAHTYDVRNGLLYRKIDRNRVSSWLPVVPRSLAWTLINHIHSEIQHLGYDKTLDKIYEQYWFPEMSKNVRRFVDSCIVCRASKGTSGAQAVRLHPIPKVSIPWHTIHIDISGKLSGKSDRKEYCSVIIDSFTKYVLLEYTPSLNATSATKALKNAVCLFGAPKRVIADRGRCYISSEFKTFCKDHNIELHLIATGSSRANGQVERVMRTLKSMLTIIENDPHKIWREQLGEVQLAINSTRSKTTKYSPTELMFGVRAQSLGISKICGVTEEVGRLDLENIRTEASKNIEKAALSDTERFNKGRARIKPFSVGDFVFVKCSERNQTKLERKFKGPFIINDVLDNDRYELRNFSGSRLYKYAHENLRAVPQGYEGLVEIATNLLNDDDDDEAVTASSECVVGTHDVDDVSNMSPRSDTLTAGSDTLTTVSRPNTDGSDTVSAFSDTMSIASGTLTACSDDED